MTHPTLEAATAEGQRMWGDGRTDIRILVVRDRLRRYALRIAPAGQEVTFKPGDRVLRIWNPMVASARYNAPSERCRMRGGGSGLGRVSKVRSYQPETEPPALYQSGRRIGGRDHALRVRSRLLTQITRAPATASELAARTRTPPAMVARQLRYLIARGRIHRDGTRYVYGGVVV